MQKTNGSEQVTCQHTCVEMLSQNQPQNQQWQKTCFIVSLFAGKHFKHVDESSCTRGRVLTFHPINAFFILVMLPSDGEY